ncbi:hypothetical protein [Pontiella sp.]
MEAQKVNVLYDENGKPVRVQVDYDLYQWLISEVSQAERKFATAG